MASIRTSNVTARIRGCQEHFTFDTFFLHFLARAGRGPESVGKWARGKNNFDYDFLLVLEERAAPHRFVSKRDFWLPSVRSLSRRILLCRLGRLCTTNNGSLSSNNEEVITKPRQAASVWSAHRKKQRLHGGLNRRAGQLRSPETIQS